MENTGKTTLRLLMPQWQGGNNPPYSFGARLLAWLAPASDDPFLEVPVPTAGQASASLENGIIERKALVRQAKAARNLIDAHQPDRVVVFGGDCLVSLAPFAYLNERYDGQLGVLWIDAHPDVTTPKDYQNAHAMVLGNLLGEGDADFTAEVKRSLAPERVMFAGLQRVLDYEAEVIGRRSLRYAGPRELADNSQPVEAWIKENDITRLAVHLDLDVLDPALFRSLLFANPATPPAAFDGVAQGEMTLPQVARLINDAGRLADVVGLSIAEHLPWDSLALKNMLEQLPLLKK